jgi:hypothetical protein
MKKALLIIIAALLSHLCHSQLIDNKLDISAGYGTGSFIGSETIADGSFIYPSFYNNFQDLTWFSLKGLVKKNEIVSFGSEIEYLSASDWSLNNYELYDDSKVNFILLAPVIQFHSRFKETGFRNRVKVYFEAGPKAGVANIGLTNPVVTIQSYEFPVTQPLKSTDFIFGMGESIGFELAINQLIGINVTYSVDQIHVKSKLYNDSHYFSSRFGCGLVVKLMKDKRYFY